MPFTSHTFGYTTNYSTPHDHSNNSFTHPIFRKELRRHCRQNHTTRNTPNSPTSLARVHIVSRFTTNTSPPPPVSRPAVARQSHGSPAVQTATMDVLQPQALRVRRFLRTSFKLGITAVGHHPQSGGNLQSASQPRPTTHAAPAKRPRYSSASSIRRVCMSADSC